MRPPVVLLFHRIQGIPLDAAKDRLYDQFARIGRALGSPARLEMMDLLAQGEKTVEQLAEQARLGIKNASAHLRALREARLVETRKESPYVFYRLADPAVVRLLRELQAIAEARLAEVEQISRLYFEDSEEMEPVGAEELLRRLEENAVTVLDVRPADEYRAGHIAGAISIPVEHLERRLAELPRDRPVVAYCRGPYCVYALDAVEVLRGHGYEAQRMEGGLPDWRLAGHPVHTGES